jgi:hypothetical protein
MHVILIRFISLVFAIFKTETSQLVWAYQFVESINTDRSRGVASN